MWLSQLELVNFRNFRRLRLEPQPGVLLFCGRNGQGKTNLLEAIYVLATTRSPRTSTERELLNWQAAEDRDLAAVITPFARLEGRVRRLEGEAHLELSFESDRVGSEQSDQAAITRVIKVNGLPQRATGLVGQLPVVYFSPDDVSLASGSPAGRRQYLNLANSQASSQHLRALQRYNRVLLQRNQVLRQVRERRQPAAALDAWTEQMLHWGTQVLHQRLAMLAQVEERAAAIFPELSGLPDALSIRYRSTACDVRHQPQPDELAHEFRARQQQVAAREIEQAVSLVGPHRDDFTFQLDGVDLNAYGSRGQQRLAVLALKLAEADWMRAEVGELPAVLLDDVLSELDPERRRYVLLRVAAPEPTGQRQVWITTTDDTAFSKELATSTQRFQIDAGQVRRA
jgi:DNA replication and repair protein RecF